MKHKFKDFWFTSIVGCYRYFPNGDYWAYDTDLSRWTKEMYQEYRIWGYNKETSLPNNLINLLIGYKPKP